MGSSKSNFGLLAAGMLPDPKTFADAGDPVDLVVLEAADFAGRPTTGRYVNFVCTSWYREGCALHYIGLGYTKIT